MVELETGKVAGKVETGTPPTPPPVPVSLEALQKESQDLKEKLQGMQKQVTDITTESATVRQRNAELEAEVAKPAVAVATQNKSELDAIAELSETDPKEAIKRMAVYNNNQLVQMRTETEKKQALERQFLAYVNDIYAKNPALKPYDNFLAPTVRQLIAQGVNPYGAVNTAVQDLKKVLGQKATPPVPPTPEVPSGAQGEGGPSLLPPKPAPPEPEQTTADVINEREEARMKKVAKK